MFAVIADGLLFDGWDTPLVDLQAEVRVYLLDQLGDEWVVDEAMPRVRLERASWSDMYGDGAGGFVHDCADHLPEETSPETCMPDARHVVIAAGLPPLG
jgi:hypothetical protein